MPLVATRGAASAQGFGEFGAVTAPIYIEDVFSTYLYTGNSSTQTITNNIDLSGKGGLVWIKNRDQTNRPHILNDTARGADNNLFSNLTNASSTGQGFSSFNNNGFSLSNASSNTNQSAWLYASWTFREQAKFFDVVTYTGDGVTGGRQIAHNLGSEPGCIIIKATSVGGTPAGWITPADWWVYHRGLPSPSNFSLRLNTTAAQNNSGGLVRTSTTFTVYGGDPASVIADNVNGVTYVAYLFAHDAGGFGLTGTDNVISCGSFTTDGSGNFSVNLGYEPQFVMYKGVAGGAWLMFDTMRGMSLASGGDAYLQAQSSAAEATSSVISPTATGFNNDPTGFGPNITYIYIAIRRGPMKVPTIGTSVFTPTLISASTGTAVTTNFPIDLQIFTATGLSDNRSVVDRLRGVNTTTTLSSLPRLITESTSAETISTLYTRNWGSVGFEVPGSNGGVSSIYWNFRRAPGFFDVVAYTGAGSPTTVTHNLGVAPELIITKGRSSSADWYTYSQTTGKDKWLLLSANFGTFDSTQMWNSTTPTATQFQVGGANSNSGVTYIAYLFATVAGVSKVGSYTGTGTTKQIDCGFTGGARFVLIKRTDSTGDWYVWDTARGIVAGNDPYLLLNSTAAQDASTDYIDTYSAGFEISSTAPAAINANGGTFIFLAIA